MSTDRVEIEGDWEFNEDVADAFDDMLQRSIPQYDVMRDAVLDVATELAPRRTELSFLDLGTSRGEVLDRFVRRFGARGRYVGVEISEPMAAIAERRQADVFNVEIRRDDLREGLPYGETFDVVTAVLTLCFIPVEHRQRLLWDVYRAMPSDGVLIVVEKTTAPSPEIEAAYTTWYRKLKHGNGYSTESIERKAAALEGVLVPVSTAMTEELLHGAGFSLVETFWRWGPFVGWVALP